MRNKGDIMEFTINDIVWSIKDTSKEWLIDKYNSEHDEKCTYVFGLCDYATHIIHINEELFFNEKIILHLCELYV